MVTIVELNFNIQAINALFYDYIEYIDSVNFTDENEKAYTTSETLIANVKKCAYTGVQYLEEQKKEGLTEYSLVLLQDSNIFDVCFMIYGVVDDESFDKLIVANDLMAYDRTDIDPNDPILRKGLKIIYYK